MKWKEKVGVGIGWIGFLVWSVYIWKLGIEESIRLKMSLGVIVATIVVLQVLIYLMISLFFNADEDGFDLKNNIVWWIQGIILGTLVWMYSMGLGKLKMEMVNYDLVWFLGVGCLWLVWNGGKLWTIESDQERG